MKKSNIAYIIILVLSIALAGAVGYIIYEKAMVKIEVDDNINQTATSNNADTYNTIIDKNSYVLEAYNKRAVWSVPESLILDDFDKYETVVNEAILPKLNINTDNAKKLNSKIMNDYKYVTEIIDAKKAENENDYVKSRKINYEYFINNDIVFIIIDNYERIYHGGTDGNIKEYYYDIKNDKELSVVEVCEKFGFTLDRINKAINSRYNVSERIPLSSLDQVLAIRQQGNNTKIFNIYHYDKDGHYIIETINIMFD